MASSEEGSCPGCGHIQSESFNQDESTIDTSTNYSQSASLNLSSRKSVAKDDSKLEWVKNFFRNNIDGRDDEFASNPKSFLLDVEAKVLAVYEQTPNQQSQNILSAFLSWVNVTMGRFERGYEYGVKGAESEERYFRDQAFTSIFSALDNLQKNDEFKFWLERAEEVGLNDLAFHQMQYFINTRQLEEALQKCREHYFHNPDWATYHQARIYNELGILDEAELLYRKLISRRPTEQICASSANSLAWSILMPEKRFTEAEAILTRVLCTNDMREKINAYSNLAMVAFGLKEYEAATRYALVGSESHEVAIASESRLTLLKIENQRLLEQESSTQLEWEALMNKVIDCIRETDFDDAGALFELLISSAEKSSLGKELSRIIEEQYSQLQENAEWEFNEKNRSDIEKLRVERLSELFLDERRYKELEELFLESLKYLNTENIPALLEFLRLKEASTSLRRLCLDIQNIEFLKEWASFEDDNEILEILSNRSEEPILLAIAENPATSDSILLKIASVEDLDLDYAISTRFHLSSKLVDVLIGSQFESVRREIAKRIDMPNSVYEILATDSALIVREAIRENTACTLELKALAALGSL